MFRQNGKLWDVASEQEDFISDYTDTELDEKHQQQEQDQSEPDEAEKQLRHLLMEDVKQERKILQTEEDAQGECKQAFHEILANFSHFMK